MSQLLPITFSPPTPCALPSKLAFALPYATETSLHIASGFVLPLQSPCRRLCYRTSTSIRGFPSLQTAVLPFPSGHSVSSRATAAPISRLNLEITFSYWIPSMARPSDAGREVWVVKIQFEAESSGIVEGCPCARVWPVGSCVMERIRAIRGG
jgi:hypothetical protein